LAFSKPSTIAEPAETRTCSGKHVLAFMVFKDFAILSVNSKRAEAFRRIKEFLLSVAGNEFGHLFVAKDYDFINALSETEQFQEKGCAYLRRSKLESYEAILEALIKKPQPMDRIAYETNMDCTVLQKRLGFLVENGLVQERPLTKDTNYAITERGVAVFKTLNFRRYLEKVSSTLSAIDDAMQTLPIISANYKEQSEEQNEKY
jgi:predicted transcriptional regulator